MKTKIITSLIVVAVLTLSFSFISVKNIAKEKKSITLTEANRASTPVGGLASTDKLD